MSKRVRNEKPATLTGKISYAHNIQVIKYLEEHNLNRSEYVRMGSELMLKIEDDRIKEQNLFNLIANITFIVVAHVSGISESEKLEAKRECFSELSKLGVFNV